MALEVVDLSVAGALNLRHRVERCTFSVDANRIAVCLGDFSVRVYATRSAHVANDGGTSPAPTPSCIDTSHTTHALSLLCSLKGHTSSVWGVDFSRDGTLLCSCSSDKTVRVWNLERQEMCLKHMEHSDTVWCCSFVHSPPDYVVSGSSDKTVKIWNIHTRDIVQCLNIYDGAVETLSFSRDWTQLCTGSRDGKIVIWTNIFSKATLTYRVLYVAEEWIRFVSFSSFHPGLLATSGNCRSILVWDLESDDFKYSDSDASKVATNSSCTDKIMRTSDYINISGGPSYRERDMPVKTVEPKLVLQGHLNTVWNSCFAHIGKPGTNEIKMLLVSCSGDRSIR